MVRSAHRIGSSTRRRIVPRRAPSARYLVIRYQHDRGFGAGRQNGLWHLVSWSIPRGASLGIGDPKGFEAARASSEPACPPSSRCRAGLTVGAEKVVRADAARAANAGGGPDAAIAAVATDSEQQ